MKRQIMHDKLTEVKIMHIFLKDLKNGICIEFKLLYFPDNYNYIAFYDTHEYLTMIYIYAILHTWKYLKVITFNLISTEFFFVLFFTNDEIYFFHIFF